MVSHSTVRWEGGKVHSSLETGLMEPSYHRVYCSLVPRLPPHGDALEESLGMWPSLLYVYQCSKPCLFLISGRGSKPLVKEKLSYVANSLNEDW